MPTGGISRRRVLRAAVQSGTAAYAISASAASPASHSGQAAADGPAKGHQRLSLDQLRQWESLGYGLHVWTVDTFDDVQLCMRSGVQAIITNQPADVLRWREEVWSAERRA